MDTLKAVFDQPVVPLGSLLPADTSIACARLHKLLWETIYAVKPESNFGLAHSIDNSTTKPSQSVIVDSLVRKAFKEFGEDGHMLSKGFRQAGKGNFETSIGGGALESKFPNWIVSFFKSRDWETILSAIGEDRMRFILWDIPMLLIKQGKGFIQLTGRPFPALAPTVADKAKDDQQLTEAPLSLLPSTKTDRRYDVEQRLWTLPSTHILSKLCLLSKSGSPSRTQAQQLANAMTQGGPDESMSSSKTGRLRLSRPWIEALPKLQQLLANFKRCRLTAVFGKVRTRHNERISVDTERLLDALSRTDIPGEIVSDFLKSALLQIVPSTFWGSPQTKRRLLKTIESQLVRGAASDVPTWKEILNGLHIKDFSWLSVKATKQEKREALRRWLIFLLDTLGMQILRSCFKVLRDETGRPVFFTQRAWKDVVLTELASEMRRFEPIQGEKRTLTDSIMAKRKFGMPLARFMQKKKTGGFRLILNMSSRGPKYPLAPNQALRPAFHALTAELEQDPSLGGAFVHGMETIFERYRGYLRSHRAVTTDGSDLRLYAVTLDIRKCFDTIRHDKLLDCVQRALCSEEYVVSSKSVSFLDRAQCTVRAKRLKLARPSHQDQLPSLSGLLSDRAVLDQPCVVTDDFVRQFVSRARVVELVKELVERTFVTFENKRFHMTQGVPQGSILSTLLCRLYYGAFEKENVLRLLNEKEDLVMRMVDDYLLLTPCKERADAFMEVMSEGNEEWCCFVNRDKSRSASHSGPSPWIPWCGLLFNVRRGWVRLKFDGPDCFSQARAFKRGIGRTMRAAFAVKCRALLLDLEINSVTNILLNISQMLAVCAARFCNCLTYAQRIGIPVSDVASHKREMIDLFSFAHALTVSRAKLAGNAFTLSDMTCLGWLAFELTLGSTSWQALAEVVHVEFLHSAELRRQLILKEKVNWEAIEDGCRYAVNLLRA